MEVLTQSYLMIVLVVLASLQKSASKTLQRLYIPYNAPVGYTVTKLTDKNSTIDLTGEVSKDLFYQTEVGDIVTKSRLSDLEHTGFGKIISLPKRSAFTGAIIEYLHIKIVGPDNFSFPQTKYIGTIRENQEPGSQVKIIGHLAITDSHFKNITYLLQSEHDGFAIETVSYGDMHDNKINALQSFDRECTQIYSFLLQAESCTGEVAISKVEIHVLDENDSIPKFQQSVLIVQTNSGPNWHSVITVQAFDQDLNDKISYSLVGSADFMIDEDTGEIFSEVDYLFIGSYSVSVFATDAVGHISAPLLIHIHVQSEGGSLKFIPNSYHHLSKRATTTISKLFVIVENSTSFSPVFSVASTQPRPASSTEEYGLISSSADIFRQPDVNGNVYLKPGIRLDYEDPSHREIRLIFNRTHMFAPGDITILEVTLRVKDKNDEKPVFKNKPVPFLAAVSTNPGLGEVVYILYAEDPDLNSNLVYNLESGDKGKFSMVTEADPRTGDMVGKLITTVSGPGQFEEGVEYTLVVSAQDKSAGISPPQKSNFRMVNVLAGLRPPQLFENPFIAQVYENSGVGYKILDSDGSILVIKAKCFQDSLKNHVSFELVEQSGKISSLFSITSRDYVETLQNLDYEDSPKQYQLNVIATELETGLKSTSEIIINVLDVNDNSPKFLYSTYTFTLSEDTPIGETALPLLVTATDRDSGLNGELEYKVSDNHFSIETKFIDNQYVGQIKVAKKLDYDFTPDHQYRFNVTATDKGEIARSGLATVIVYVENVNDEVPVFEVGTDHLYATISEEQTVGSVVTIIQAADPDGDNVKYYFTARSTESGPFRIDPDSGLIMLARSLPETVPVYMLNITAYDDGSCCPGVKSLSSDTYILVEIRDMNNNQPQFPDCSYEPEVLENQRVGTLVVQVTAVDNDRGANGNITYSIVTSPLQPKQFEVNPGTGRVVTAVKFDREAQFSDRGISVTVKAADQGQPQPLDTYCTFWVRIGDVNDNPPVFDSPSYSTSISEASTTKGGRVFRVRAYDQDKGRNAAIVYTLTENPGGFFKIEPDSGIIYLEKTISGTEDINIVVKAEDQGNPPLSAYVTVSISVIDRNNNPPTWDSSNYEREYVIKETAPIGYTIATMSASSNTPPPFDGVTFALIDSKDNTRQAIGPFRIHQDGSTVTLILKGTLNYNIQNRYELRMRVTNQGQIPLSVEIRPIIVVKDMNNEPPQFEGLDSDLSNSYKASVPENEPPGQPVLQIKAVDPDHDPPNNLVTYSILEDKNDAYLHFDINRQNGSITTLSSFDREEADKSVYYIKVMAVDGTKSDAPGHFPPGTPNSATAQVQISIADKNDNAPYFTESSWSAQVPEQRPDDVGRIVTVTAKDKDEADLLTYSITGGNVGSVFGIKQKTGDIYVAKTLDYEVPPTNYNLTVMVSDGLFQNTASVLIEVSDVNDNEPEFNQEVYEITDVIEETIPPPEGKFLLQVFATDKDVSRQTNFRFSISGYGTASPSPLFTIEPDTGKIFLHGKLDRDLPYGRDVYQFNVIAEDEPDTQGSLSGYAYVKVRPKDINDNNPQFDSKGLQGSVAEHSPAGQSVMTVIAEDFDAGENGTVFYEIDRYGNPPADPKTGEWLFQINSETGLIQTKISDSLDRESTAQYFLQIIAKDKGVEQRSTTATVTIRISDINDQPPVFVEKIYRVHMSENQETGPVITVSATDNDIDENARLTYTLEETDSKYFFIEKVPPNAGVLTVYNPVDYELVKFFNLTVKVKDGKHEDKAYIEVVVEDYNDNAPEFSPKVKTLRNVPENVPEYTSLWNCSATDADSGQNAEFEYSIDRSTDEGHRFTVNSKCEVKVKRGLDGETLDREALTGLPQEKYEVRILAKDKGYPSQTGSAVLRIYVEDLNDNAPMFVLPHPPMVMEGEPPPQHVITFSARDKDTAAYGPPFKFEMVPCEENPSCDKKTGALAFNMTFDEKGANGTGTGRVTALKTFWRDDQKYHYLPIIMSDMRGKESAKSNTGTSTLTIEIGDINNHEQKPGHKDIFVYKYDFKGVDEDLAIGNVYAEDPDDWDVKDKHYYFTGPRNMANYFSVNFDDGTIRMNKQTPSGIHDFKAKVHDYVKHPWANVTCTVRVVVEEITDEAIYSSGSVRLTGITAEEFVARPSKGKSPYDKFRILLADRLNVDVSNVAIFSVMNSENKYTDVRYSAHGSPWYPASMLDGIISLEKKKFENTAGVKIAMVNIDMCLRELCESGGCSNILLIGDQPNYVNTNDTAFIGISTEVKAECRCEATDTSTPPECTPGYCYNGGTCKKDEWGDVSCDCTEAGWHMKGASKLTFDGPRCQMTRHSFDGGYALFPPFRQCEESTTSIEILPKTEDGLIFYSGPVSKLERDDPTDYIALWLKDGYPVLSIDHGSGAVNLTVDGRDQKGIRHLQKLTDGRWHHIDIIRKRKSVKMIIDRCDMTKVDSSSDTVVDMTPCEVSGTTRAENYFLNVNTHVQLGGVYSDFTHHPYLLTERFYGCMRNLVNNGELYDLYTGHYSKGENHVNGCPDEDMVCLNSLAGPRCGKHGICELTDAFNKLYKCTCKPGYRTAGPGKETCAIRTTIRDLNVTSYMSWTLKYDFLNEDVEPRKTEIQLRFRTRDKDGILLHLPSNTEEFITLELVGGRVHVLYNLGDVKVKSDGESVLSLVAAPANNGQWHTVYMKRIGKWFQLKMDGGEGRYYNETWGPENGHQLFSLKMYNIVSGAHVVFTKNPIAQGQDLTKTCIDDIRLNGEWFPMQNSENELSYAAALEYERNVYMGCIRDDCLNVDCPKGIPEPMICVPLWGTHECRCPAGTYVDGYNCVPIDYCLRDNPCFSGATCITKPYPTNFTCLCPSGLAGHLCNKLKAVDPASAGITTGFIMIIIVCIFIVLIVPLLVFLLVRYKRRSDPEKYFLDDELEDDVRENVVNYNEEGAGEEDQNAYDISRLCKPDDVDTVHKMPFDPMMTERYPRRGVGDKPDVRGFIDDRLFQADNDVNAPPHDSVREFINEGGNSDVGSLSSLNTSSSQEDQDYDYLNDWGPKFSKLANMYGGDDEDDL